MKIDYRVNNLIKYKIIKLLDENSKYLGIFKICDCFKKSKLLNLDLVEIGTKNNFSICKIINFKKFKYFQLKKNKKKLNFLEVNKKNKKTKEIKFHLFTSGNDYINKIKYIKNFLNKNLKVKITVMIKGREILKQLIIDSFINRIVDDIKQYGVLVSKSCVKSKLIFIYFDPKNKKSKTKNNDFLKTFIH